MTDDMEKFVRELVARHSPMGVAADDIGLNDSFDDLSIDSMHMAELLFEVERELGVEATEEELMNQQQWLQTPSSLLRFIVERGASTPRSTS